MKASTQQTYNDMRSLSTLCVNKSRASVAQKMTAAQQYTDDVGTSGRCWTQRNAKTERPGLRQRHGQEHALGGIKKALTATLHRAIAPILCGTIWKG